MTTACRLVLGLALIAISGCDVYDTRLLSPAISSDGGGPENVRVMAECGNGVVDKGESCDTAIDASQPGACPSTCPAGDPCKPQLVAGMGGCQAQCLTVPITHPSNDDGCCPAGSDPGTDSDCGGCGDNIIGPKETCDPPESCQKPADCGAMNTCLVGTFHGDPDNCTSTCDYAVIQNCKSGDGCCPVNCDPTSDDDCSTSCMNGIVETSAGETCEPGSSTPCPESCDDGNACTTDIKSGSPERCNVTCSHIGIQMPASNDGCCPMGANALNDSDCLPICGNNVREMPELCDPCPADCDDADPCTTDERSGSDCNVSCNHTPVTDPVSGDGCCPNGASAANDNDCSASCGNGVTEPGEECDGGGLCRNCQLIFNPALIHRYNFDGTGTTVADSVGNADGVAVNFTLSNGSADLMSSVTGNYVEFPPGIISGLSEVTFEVWLKWDGGGNRQRIFDFGDYSGTSTSRTGTSFFMLEPANSGGKLATYANFTPQSSDSANDWATVAGGALSQSGVKHVAVTFSGTRVSLYLDGIRQTYTDSSAKSLSDISDQHNWLGRSQFSADPELDAIIYEFRIYSKALSQSEVKASFDAGQNP